MRTDVETVNAYSRKLKVDISPEELATLEHKVLKNYQRRAEIPGFRPGKAPLNIVRQRHSELIKQELIDEALRKFYSEALGEANINPVSQGKIIDFKFENIKSGMQFEIEVEVEPEIELKKYKGLKVDRDVVSVTDEMVDRALQQLREQYATVKEINQAEKDHYIYFNAQELDKGDVPIVGHKYENLHVQLGSGKFDSEIEKQLIGIKKGEKRIVGKETIKLGPNKEEQKQRSSLEIHVKKIEEKEFPELDDTFVQNLNENKLENLQQLKERIRNNLAIDLQQRTEDLLRNRLIDELLKENPTDVPPSMVENYLDSLIEDIKKQSKDRNVDEESIRKEYRPAAIHNLRWHFLKKKLIEAENISITQEEINNMIDAANLDKKTRNRLTSDKHYMDHLREDLIEKKVIEMLKQNGEIIEVYPYKQSDNKE